MTLNAQQYRQIADAALRHKLALVLLFGSRSRGTAHAGSDTDIAVLGQARLRLKTLTALERVFRGVFGGKVDVVDLNAAPPLLGDRIMRDAQLLAGEPRDFALARMRFHARYLDFKPYLELRRAALSKAFAV